MALGGEDGSVSIVTPSDWNIEKEIKIVATAITAVRFSRHNERLAIGSSDGIVTLLDPEDGWNIAGEIETSDAGISCIDWSSRHLAVGRFDGTVAVHEASRVYENFFLTESELTRGDKPVYSVSFGVGGQFLGTFPIVAGEKCGSNPRNSLIPFSCCASSSWRWYGEGWNIQRKGWLGTVPSAQHSKRCPRY